MKYKITITKIEQKTVKERNWVMVDPYIDKDGKEKEFDYRTEEKQKEMEEEVYQQTSETDIDLKAIIDAFNTPPKA